MNISETLFYPIHNTNPMNTAVWWYWELYLLTKKLFYTATVYFLKTDYCRLVLFIFNNNPYILTNRLSENCF